jgi:CBS domain-containing protein
MQLTDPVRLVLDRKGWDVWSIGPSDSVYDAIARMAEKGVGALVVLDGDALAGIISERDYARKVILQHRSSRETPVGEIMTRDVLTVSPDKTVDDCMQLMTARHVRHLPVVEGGRVRGMISIGDLVRWVISAQKQTIEQLSAYISGSYPA